MSLISGNISFYDNSTNDSSDPNSIIGLPSFLDNSSNQGVITSGLFSGSAFNAGQVSTATFAGNSINSGVVSVAEFVGTASNLGTISDSGSFYGSAVNNGVVGTAIFTGGAVNLGTITGSGLFYGTSTNSGVISGNAVFADTTTNNGTVEGNANFATGASNQGGTVNGETGVYTPPSSGNWFNDSSSVARAVTLSGVVTQSNEGSGVVAAEFDGSNNLSLAPDTDFDFGTGDFTVELFAKLSAGDNKYILSTSYYYNGWVLRVAPNGEYIQFFSANHAAQEGYSANTISDIVDNQWHHIAAVRENGILSIYIDGVREYNNAYNVDIFNSAGYEYGLHVGGSGSGSDITGKLAAVRIIKGTAIYSGSTISVPTSLLTTVTGTQLLLNFGATNVPNLFATVDAAALAQNLNGFGDGTIGRNGYYYLNGTLSNFSYNELTFVNGLAYSNGILFTGNASWNNQAYVSGKGIPFPIYGTVLSTETNTIFISEANQTVNNGTYDVIADGSGGSYNGNYQYAVNGTVLYDDNSTYHYVSNGSGGYTQYYRTGYLVESGVGYPTYITEASTSVNNGTADKYADGSGGFTYSNHAYASNGTVIYDDLTTYHYVSNGSGSYTQYYRSGYVISTEVTTVYVSQLNTTVNTGTYDVIADGSGGSTNGNYQYAANGTVLYDDNSTYHYVSDASGGYVRYYRTGYIIQTGVSYTLFYITEADQTVTNGTANEVADGVGGSTWTNHAWASNGYELYNDGTYHYLSDGSGGYNQYYVQGYNLGNISCTCYGIGTNNGFVCADGSIYALANDSVIGCNYCCADGNGGCMNVYCALGYWICYNSCNPETCQYDIPGCVNVN